MLHGLLLKATLLHACTPVSRRITFVTRLVGPLFYLLFVLHPCGYNNMHCTVNLAPCHTSVWPVAAMLMHGTVYKLL